MAKKNRSSQPTIDKSWEAESDARTLAQAEEIRNDKSRASRAINAAKKLANEAQKNLGRTVKAVKGKK